MFSPRNSKPMSTFDRRTNQTLNTSFTHNLHDMRYKTNHGGRDSYIQDSNGGFTISNVIVPSHQTTAMLPSLHTARQTSVSPRGAPAVDTQRPIHYKGNGTGRDTYIQSNNGGFTTHLDGGVAADARIVFKKNLRSYEPDATYLQRRNYTRAGVKQSNLSHIMNCSPALTSINSLTNDQAQVIVKTEPDEPIVLQAFSPLRRTSTQGNNQ